MFLRTFTGLFLIALLAYALGYRSGYEEAVTRRAIRDLGLSILRSIGDLTDEDDELDASETVA